MNFLAPCHFGLEKNLKMEIEDLGYKIQKVEDGKVYFEGDTRAIVRANLFLRTTERVLLVVGTFTATTFDELFEKTKSLEWGRYIPKDGRVWVTKANSIRSALFSPSDIQSIMKKAIVEKMKTVYQTDIISETGAEYPLRISILKDVVTVGLDTSGVSLHKRGYRIDTVKAPITETLAASLLKLTPFKEGRILADPFCGSGTFLIEAAMKEACIAPGLFRNFISENWTNLTTKRQWFDGREEARSLRKNLKEVNLFGSDIDPSAIRAAKENAKRVGVSHLISFDVKDVKDFNLKEENGFLITNPPYGERIAEKEELPVIYNALGETYRKLSDWSLYVITPYEGVEEAIGRPADRNRKIYNGMMKTYFYSFLGPKPAKKE